MTTLTCIIVDDEPIARDILKQYIMRDDRLMLEASYSNAADALREINVIKPVLMFLDIKMPKISGFELIRSMPQHPYVIFTTAYREYAVEGFDLNAVDYLLKPFSFDRFLQAVNKASTLIFAEKAEKPLAAPPDEEKDLFIKVKAAYDLQQLEVLQKILLSLEDPSANLYDYFTEDERDAQIMFLEKQIASLQDKIDELQQNFPFDIANLLFDENYIAQKQEEIKLQIQHCDEDIKKYAHIIYIMTDE